jgi:two-component system CheB/CheR fusion protein
LQSTNEELSTVNSELQNKVDELSKSSSDMNNLLAATEIASIFLDTRLCIKRYTPATAEVIKLIQTDIGRPIGDLKTSFPEVDLANQAKAVLKTSIPSARNPCRRRHLVRHKDDALPDD